MICSTLFSFAACSSTTEPGAGGFRSSLSVTPQTTSVGGTVDAIWTIQNTSEDTIVRDFNPFGSQGYFLMITTTDSTVLGNHGRDVEVIQGHTLTLAPHAKMTMTAHFDALASGSAMVSGCLPPDSAQTDYTWNCISQTVTVRPPPI